MMLLLLFLHNHHRLDRHVDTVRQVTRNEWVQGRQLRVTKLPCSQELPNVLANMVGQKSIFTTIKENNRKLH